MSIQIDCIRIFGFRGIKKTEIHLPRVALLIGTNNSGKTSVIKALQLALGDYSRFLTDQDFHINKDDKRCSEILVDVRIVPIDEDGKRSKDFSDEWVEEFEDKIRFEVDDTQFLPIRTKAFSDSIKGGFKAERYILDEWPDASNWETIKTTKSKKLTKRYDSLPYFSIDAQRDIHQELNEKNSFVGRVLSSVDYEKADVVDLEKMVAKINTAAVEKSEPLKELKDNLDSLSQSFDGVGTAELTPFPKKIRDLSKRFSIHFGESKDHSFSMEYHGMGTRSWASMLTVRAFSDLMGKNHEKEAKPYHPILAAEEPEAHLHPNAQRTLYRQLVQSKGQVIISTHSPYLAGLADPYELRYLNKTGDNINVHYLNAALTPEDVRKIHREIIHTRGEILFSRAMILSEGETEEQSLPQLFAKYFDAEPFSLGVNFIGVGGSGKYTPFLQLAKDFNIPVFIFSDGEPHITKALKKHYEEVYGTTDINDCDKITILEDTDFEGYLMNSGFEDEIKAAITKTEVDIEAWINKKQGSVKGRIKTNEPKCKSCDQYIFKSELRDYTGPDGKRKAMLEILDENKPMYAQAVTDEFCEKDKDGLPPKVIEFFKKIKKELSL